MALVLGFIGILFLAAIVLPQWWVRRVMRRHAAERTDFPGTGGELARHLLDRARLPDVRVELAPPGGDHYDPIDKVVRLSPDNHDGRSITAVAVTKSCLMMSSSSGRERMLPPTLKPVSQSRVVNSL